MRAGLVLALALLLCACGRPVPADKADYVGDWRAPGMQLLITADGRVEYERRRGSATTSIKAPLQRFIGDDFEVGVGLMTTVFEVSGPPRLLGERWVMVVDGVELTRLGY